MTYLILLGLIGGLLLLILPQVKQLIQLLKTKMHPSIHPKKISTEPVTPKTDITMALLCQLSHRISSKLKSAYPGALWDWDGKPYVKRILDGEVMRIRTRHTGEYNYAEMHLDNYGNIILQMMSIQSLHPTVPTDPDANKPMIVDCSSWYSLLGQKALTDIISVVNCHGHSNLYLDDSGNVLLKGDEGNQKSQYQLPHFPGQKYYEELISIFAQAELTAVVENGAIKLSW
jgi:hypothetical protein